MPARGISLSGECWSLGVLDWSGANGLFGGCWLASGVLTLVGGGEDIRLFSGCWHVRTGCWRGGHLWGGEGKELWTHECYRFCFHR